MALPKWSIKPGGPTVLERRKGAENWERISSRKKERKSLISYKEGGIPKRREQSTVPSMAEGKFSSLICQAENCRLPW